MRQLTLNLTLDNGTKELLEVNNTDTPKRLAQQVCIKHGLNQDQRKKLALKISQGINESMLSPLSSVLSSSQRSVDERLSDKSRFNILNTKGHINSLSQIYDRFKDTKDRNIKCKDYINKEDLILHNRKNCAMYRAPMIHKVKEEKGVEYQKEMRNVKGIKKVTFHPHYKTNIVRTKPYENNYTQKTRDLNKRIGVSFDASKTKQYNKVKVDKDAINQRFERLFQDARRRNQRFTLIHTDMKCTFSPSINESHYHKRKNCITRNVLPVRKTLFRSSSACNL